MKEGTEMADEPTLRHLFGDPPPAPTIDVSNVIRRSRSRRAPRILGAGALSVLAATTLVYAGFSGLSGLADSTASDAGGAAPMSESGVAGDEKNFSSESLYAASSDLFRCGQPVFEIPENELGLELSVDVASPVEVTSASIDGTVTVTNGGDDPVSVVASTTPTLALTADGIVVWRSQAGLTQRSLDLEPGDTFDYDVSFSPTVCVPNGAERSAALPAGEYELHAAIDVGTADGQSPGAPWASGPPQPLTLRGGGARTNPHGHHDC
jgi:hypothetical protein